MGNVSMDISLANIWQSWYRFCRGKRKTKELEIFQYFLEENLQQLHRDLENKTYAHGDYKKFIVNENKKREISVASIKDRVLHRLVYEYLVEIYDRTFIFDAWSCRKNKGLVGAIERTQKFLKEYSNSYVWRSDISKFFDSVNQEILLKIIYRKISDENTRKLIKEIIDSYQTNSEAQIERERERERESKCASPKGIPIGNLTSQIFANIYLNEFDRFAKHVLKPQAYLRYGDDFIFIELNRDVLTSKRETAIKFLSEKLKLEINSKNDILTKVKSGLHFLGVEVFPKGRKLKNRNWKRAQDRLNSQNAASYDGLIKKHCNAKKKKHFNWIIFNHQDEI